MKLCLELSGSRKIVRKGGKGSTVVRSQLSVLMVLLTES